MAHNLKELTKEEAEQLTKELTAVLEKYNCEIGVKSSIEILKRVEIKQEDGVESPYIENGNTGESTTNEETPKID